MLITDNRLLGTSYNFDDSSTIEVAYEPSGEYAISFPSYKVNDVALGNFRKGILFEDYYCDYSTTNATILNTAFASRPYAVAGITTGYSVNGGDIGKRIAPLYTIYTSNQTSVSLQTGWTKIGLLAIGGGGGGGAGGTHNNIDGGMSGGCGGGAGGVAFAYVTKAQLPTGTISITVGTGGRYGHYHFANTVANGAHGVAGTSSHIKINNTTVVEATGGGEGSGGWSWNQGGGGAWGWDYGGSKGSGGRGAGGLTGEAKYAGLSGVTNLGQTSTRGSGWITAVSANNNDYNTPKQSQYNAGFAEGVATSNFNIFGNNTYGNGGKGGYQGQNSGKTGSNGVVVIIQYFD